ncbi:NAD(P)-dependent oxidoreductase [Streptomyces sp. NPDC047002]|uniref:NAD(P)-dependent oxidoreductase n=1 Tax=Streptomyces sp. NPDC047002 TaxID=3155475 RepID=UPI0034515F71
METAERPRVLLVDAAPGGLLGCELERFLGHGLAVTLNLRRVADPGAVRQEWGGRVEFTDFDPFDEAELTAAAVRADGAGHHAVKSRAGVPMREAFLAAAAGRAPAARLRVIGRAGAGTDHVDLAAAARHGVAVTHTPGSNATAVAEFALSQLLALARRLPTLNEASHGGRWSAPAGEVPELAELTLGLVGLGRTARALAGRAAALGMAVRAWTRRHDRASGDPVDRAESLAGLLATSDVVSLHVPLGPGTYGLLGGAELALMRPGSILLNTARGGIVDERALADAFADPAHPLAAAAVDTFEYEHAAFASPLFGLPNALLTPHVAGMTRGAMAAAARGCADHVAALLADRAERVPVVRG